MPTIRFVLQDSEHTVEADRVLSDSQHYVAERRAEGEWLRVATHPRAAVRSVDLRVSRDGGAEWLREVVRTSAGLAVPDHDGAAGTPSPSRPASSWRRRLTSSGLWGGNCMRVLMAGAPGAGKGTQAAVLAYELDVPHIASGELVSQEMAAGTSAGLAARSAVARGALGPDDLVVEILRPTLLLAASRGGYVLDGFPRTVAQAETVEAAVGASAVALDVVVHLDVPTAVLTRRLLARGRADDDAVVIERRLAVYRAQTLPMLDWYAQRHQLVVVDGDASVDEVSGNVVRSLQEWLLRRRLTTWAPRRAAGGSSPDAPVASPVTTPTAGRSAS